MRDVPFPTLQLPHNPHFAQPADESRMPKHWRSNFNLRPKFLAKVARVLFKMLCLVSIGHTDLRFAWEVSDHDGELWEVNKDRLATRISAVTVIVSLFDRTLLL